MKMHQNNRALAVGSNIVIWNMTFFCGRAPNKSRPLISFLRPVKDNHNGIRRMSPSWLIGADLLITVLDNGRMPEI